MPGVRGLSSLTGMSPVQGRSEWPQRRGCRLLVMVSQCLGAAFFLVALKLNEAGLLATGKEQFAPKALLFIL